MQVVREYFNNQPHSGRCVTIAIDGRTLRARSLPTILPSLAFEEALDVTRIYSVNDMQPADAPLVRVRPFRAPHHTISHAGLVGGGRWPHPGEISLAHRGVLFLDELPEFDARGLGVMRQPLDDDFQTGRLPVCGSQHTNPAIIVSDDLSDRCVRS